MLVTNEKPKTELRKSDFSYDLPPELIAQTPLEVRDSSRLMCVDRHTGKTEHRVFRDIADMLNPGDVLVVNDSKVIPARLFGVKEDTGVPMEVLLLRQRELDTWEVLCRPGKRAKIGTNIVFSDGLLRAEVVDIVEDGDRLLHFTYEGDNLYSIFDQIGQMPLPPYITEKLADRDRYQTVYARELGSAAAPTAGLHFTPELLDVIRAKGVDVVPVELRVGLGTFRPVKEDRIADHVMHTEWFSVPEDSARRINARKGRLVCVGTTSCRTVESASDENGTVKACSGDTGIFIYPGYRFKAVDALITNFHLPESTLLMLVSAFSSREIILNAYKIAVEERYRFFSFGDAMYLY